MNESKLSTPSRSRSVHGVIWTYVALAILLGCCAAQAATTPQTEWSPMLALLGAVGLAVLLGTLPLLIVMLRRPAVSDGDGSRLPRLIEDQNRLLAQINEHTMLSEGSKRLIYRTKELQLLRSAIEDDMARGDHDAALTLCNTMAEQFGFREEAEGFRETIEHARRARYETQIAECTTALDNALARRDWEVAHLEAARIRRLFPEAPLVGDLDRRIAMARDEHKQQLTERFLHAADHGEVESAMDLLRQLDRYLTKQEAQELQATAQGVVTRHRENLSVQFNLAVRERNWADAVRIGNEIIREFPNSKMADEVKSMLDVLRNRATHAAVQSASGAGV